MVAFLILTRTRDSGPHDMIAPLNMTMMPVMTIVISMLMPNTAEVKMARPLSQMPA